MVDLCVLKTDLGKSYRTGVWKDSDINKYVRKIDPDKKSEESQAQPCTLHPDREEKWRQGQDINDGFHLKHEEEEIFRSKSPQEEVHKKDDPKHKVCLTKGNFLIISFDVRVTYHQGVFVMPYNTLLNIGLGGGVHHINNLK